MDEMISLEKEREAISEIDRKSAALFNERMAHVAKIARCKMLRGLPTEDRAREKAVIENAAACVEDPLIRELLLQRMEFEISLSKKYQELLKEQTEKK